MHVTRRCVVGSIVIAHAVFTYRTAASPAVRQSAPANGPRTPREALRSTSERACAGTRSSEAVVEVGPHLEKLATPRLLPCAAPRAEPAVSGGGDDEHADPERCEREQHPTLVLVV